MKLGRWRVGINNIFPLFFRHGSHERKSEVKKKTLSPEWNHLTELLLPPSWHADPEEAASDGATNFDFDVWDWDLGKGDDFLGKISLSLIQVKEVANSQVGND